MGSRVPSANRITLLRDADGDGTPEIRSVFLEGLNSPFGMAVVGEHFYVANTDAVLRFPYVRGATRITGPGTKIVDLPAGPLNRHWTRNLIANRDGSKLYVTVGSSSNHAEKGMEREAGRAAIWEIDTNTRTHRVFASGLRNPNGLAWEPTRQTLWTVVNERDSLGSDLVPDYLTSVKAGAFYGWPYSYFGQNIDPRVKPAAARCRGHGGEAGLRARPARCAAGPSLLPAQCAAAGVRPRHVRGPARLVQPAAAQRLQRCVRTIPPGDTGRSSDRGPR
jgi:glucose/arabinose dehydrogenase